VANGLSAKQIPYFHWASVSRIANHDALVAWPAERPMETRRLMAIIPDTLCNGPRSSELSPEEEAWGAARSHYRPAYIKFLVGLSQATKGYETGKFNRECAAVAVAATIAYVKAVGLGQNHLLAPLEEALEIIESDIDPASLPYCRRAQAVVSDLDAHKGKALPPLDNFGKKKLPKAISDKIIGSVAVECQLLCKVSLNQALKLVAGQDARARKRLKDFRYNMKAKDSPKGAREEFFSVMQALAGLPPQQVAQLVLEEYRHTLGKKS
jgi:hypothetical protein